MNDRKEELRKVADKLFYLTERVSNLSFQLEEVSMALVDLHREILILGVEHEED